MTVFVEAGREEVGVVAPDGDASGTSDCRSASSWVGGKVCCTTSFRESAEAMESSCILLQGKSREELEASRRQVTFLVRSLLHEPVVKFAVLTSESIFLRTHI